MQHHEPRKVSLGGRFLRYEILGKIEIEIGKAVCPSGRHDAIMTREGVVLTTTISAGRHENGRRRSPDDLPGPSPRGFPVITISLVPR
jgi:hypothetical protein